jgi:hypothetical protein
MELIKNILIDLYKDLNTLEIDIEKYTHKNYKVDWRVFLNTLELMQKEELITGVKIRKTGKDQAMVALDNMRLTIKGITLAEKFIK